MTAQRLEYVDISERRIIDGPDDKVMQISPVKYPKPMLMLEKMMRDNWFHWDTPLNADAVQFRTMPEKLRRAVQKALGFLSNLDGIQLNTLANNIGRYVTAPEYRMALVRQTYEEEVHVLTYDRMISTLEMDAVETYNLFLSDDLLHRKNSHIIYMAERVGRDYTPENFVRAIAANQALEGIYFNMGFKLFYVLHRNGYLPGCAKNIRYINRDELSHLRVFNAMWQDLRIERPELFTREVLNDCREIMSSAALMEIAWGHHIVDGGILGLTPQIIDQHVKFLANQQAEATGLGTLFPGISRDPLEWCNGYLKEHGVDTNFFEDHVIEYDDTGLEW